MDDQQGIKASKEHYRESSYKTLQSIDTQLRSLNTKISFFVLLVVLWILFTVAMYFGVFDTAFYSTIDPAEVIQ